MENLWGMIAKARGVELNEEFLYSLSNFEYKYRVSERGLEYYDNDDDDVCRWTFSECSSEFIRGIGEIKKLSFKPKKGEKYWTYGDDGKIPKVVSHIWNNDYYDKTRKLLGIVFRTEQEAIGYIHTWEKRLEGEEV